MTCCSPSARHSPPDVAARVIAEYKARFPCGDAIRMLDCMCNLYSITKGQKAIRDLANAMVDRAGNMPSLPAIFPNGKAPVVRALPSGERDLLMMRWGFPPPNIPGSKPRNPYLTNVRNTDSRYWQNYLKKPEHRCLVPSPALRSRTTTKAQSRYGPGSLVTMAVKTAAPCSFLRVSGANWKVIEARKLRLTWETIWCLAS
jgi:hypothetical protein